jgi:hypothetical protein
LQLLFNRLFNRTIKWQQIIERWRKQVDGKKNSSMKGFSSLVLLIAGEGIIFFSGHIHNISRRCSLIKKDGGVPHHHENYVRMRGIN